MAATAIPSPADRRRGAGHPQLVLLAIERVAARTGLAQRAFQRRAIGERVDRERLQREAVERTVDGLGLKRQHRLPGPRGVRRYARPDLGEHADRALAGHLIDVHRGQAVEHDEVRRLSGVVAQCRQVWAGHCAQASRPCFDIAGDGQQLAT